MIHLVQATKLTRKILKYGGISLATTFAIIIIYNLLLFFSSILFPPEVPPIAPTFGTLQPLAFPQGSGLNYTLNTVNGQLPTFPDRFKVYKMKEQDPHLLDLKTAREKVRSIRFTVNETRLDPITYQWTSGDPPERFLRYNIITEDFELISNYRTDNQVLLAKHLPNDKEAKRIVNRFLSRMNEDILDIDEGKSQITYLRIVNGQLKRVAALNEAQIVRVDIFQNPVEKIEIYYPYTYPNESLMRFFIGSGSDTPEIVEASFTHQTVDTTQSSDYPILKSEEAFQALKEGRAYIFNPENKSEIEIVDVSLAYYIGEKAQQHLMPIVVFKGKNFKAYVSAVKN